MLIADTRKCGRCSGPSIKSYCRGCQLIRRAQDIAYDRRTKLAALDQYGGRFCACCRESHIEFLEIDHINGGGNKHRREIGQAAKKMYRWLKVNNYPSGFRVLCSNCNKSLGAFGYCPHQRVMDIDGKVEQ